MLASIWHVTPDAWTAMATWAAVCTAGIAATVAFRQLAEARQLRREQAQPYVAVFAEPTAAGPTTIDLVIKNFGTTAATDVRVRFSEPLESAALRPDHSPISVPESIPVLVPGQEWRTFWDTTHARDPASDLPMRYTAEVAFKDSRGVDVHPYIFEIDWRTLVDRGFVTIYNEHDAATALRDISRVLSSWKDAGALSVLTRDGRCVGRQAAAGMGAAAARTRRHGHRRRAIAVSRGTRSNTGLPMAAYPFDHPARARAEARSLKGALVIGAFHARRRQRGTSAAQHRRTATAFVLLRHARLVIARATEQRRRSVKMA
jgi:hypothetical protein